MPCLHLVIPDPALRAAIVEQAQSMPDTKIEMISDIALSLQKPPAVVVMDEAVADKKTLKQLRERTKDEARLCVFLLGTVDASESDLFAESFRKPLRLGHLLARLSFYMETMPRLRSVPVNFGPYRLEAQNRQLVDEVSHDIIRLTEKETALLEYLGHKTEPVGREELLAAIWGYDNAIETHTLETHIYQLRRKLDPHNKGENWLLNEQGAYRLLRKTAS